jgi:hypothetical protein
MTDFDVIFGDYKAPRPKKDRMHISTTHVVHTNPFEFNRELQKTIDKLTETDETKHRRNLDIRYETTFNGSNVAYSALLVEQWFTLTDVDEDKDDAPDGDDEDPPIHDDQLLHPLHMMFGARKVD